jgi:DNA ligase-1
MTCPILYKRDTKGSVRIWKMEQEDNKYRTISGLEDGEKVTTGWTEVQGKNEGKKNGTTGEQQASKEIEAKYKKQLKTGYFENVENIDNKNYIKPILAENYKDYADDVSFQNKEWGVQTKFNGICCIATKDGCFTRKGEKLIPVRHIEESLKPFFEKYPESFLHGELFNDDLREELNEIVRLCRKTVHITEEDYQKTKDNIQFYIYDGCIMEANLDQSQPYHKRKEWIDSNVINNYSYVTMVETTIITDKNHLDSIFLEKVNRGDEGLILRKMNMPYVHKRNKNLLKYKPRDDAEFKILDIKDGNGDWTGIAKVLTVQAENGEVFDATFKGDRKEAQECMSNKDQWINKIVTIYYFGYTGLGCPQYAQFDYKNAIK